MTSKREELERLFETAWQDGFRCSGDPDYKKRTQLLNDEAMKIIHQTRKDETAEKIKNNSSLSEDEKILTELKNLETGERILKNEITGTIMKELHQTIIALIKAHGISERIDERKLGKQDVTKMRDIYLTHSENSPLADDPMAEKAIKIRNKLREDIAEDFDKRITELEVEQKGLE